MTRGGEGAAVEGVRGIGCSFVGNGLVMLGYVGFRKGIAVMGLEVSKARVPLMPG